MHNKKKNIKKNLAFFLLLFLLELHSPGFIQNVCVRGWALPPSHVQGTCSALKSSNAHYFVLPEPINFVIYESF